MLPYECQDQYGTCIHWTKWREYLELYRESYPHNHRYRRARVDLTKPAATLLELDMAFIPKGVTTPHEWRSYSDDWSVIFEPFHLHAHDPDPSWILFLEKGHKKPSWGEPIELFSTGLTFFSQEQNHMARFRGMYYIISYLVDNGFGEADPPYCEQVRYTRKSIYDTWEPWNEVR